MNGIDPPPEAPRYGCLGFLFSLVAILSFGTALAAGWAMVDLAPGLAAILAGSLALLGACVWVLRKLAA